MLNVTVKFFDCTASVVSLAGAVVSVVTSTISLGFRLIALITACGPLLIELAKRVFTFVKEKIERLFFNQEQAPPPRTQMAQRLPPSLPSGTSAKKEKDQSLKPRMQRRHSAPLSFQLYQHTLEGEDKEKDSMHMPSKKLPAQLPSALDFSRRQAIERIKLWSSSPLKFTSPNKRG